MECVQLSDSRLQVVDPVDEVEEAESDGEQESRRLVDGLGGHAAGPRPGAAQRAPPRRRHAVLVRRVLVVAVVFVYRTQLLKNARTRNGVLSEAIVHVPKSSCCLFPFKYPTQPIEATWRARTQNG